MKKIIFICAVLICSSVYCSAITVEELINKYKSAEDVEFDDFNSVELLDRGYFEGVKGADRVILIGIYNSPESVNDAFIVDFAKIKDDNYEIIMKRKEEDERTLVLQSKSTITPPSIAVIKYDDSECVIIKFIGNVEMESLQHIFGRLTL